MEFILDTEFKREAACNNEIVSNKGFVTLVK